MPLFANGKPVLAFECPDVKTNFPGLGVRGLRHLKHFGMYVWKLNPHLFTVNHCLAKSHISKNWLAMLNIILWSQIYTNGEKHIIMLILQS